jgi:hypothetical protein
VLIPDKFVPPLLLDRYVKDMSSPWQSTVHNRLFLGIPSLALARRSLTTGLRAHDAERVGELEDLNGEVYQERILTRQYLYPVCAPVYEFNCIFEALTAIADCIRGELSTTLALAITERILHSAWSSVFAISYCRGWF